MKISKWILILLVSIGLLLSGAFLSTHTVLKKAEKKIAKIEAKYNKLKAENSKVINSKIEENKQLAKRNIELEKQVNIPKPVIIKYRDRIINKTDYVLKDECYKGLFVKDRIIKNNELQIDNLKIVDKNRIRRILECEEISKTYKKMYFTLKRKSKVKRVYFVAGVIIGGGLIYSIFKVAGR